MFYERFIQLCDLKSEKPTNVLKIIGASPGNLGNWKSGGAVKSDTLMKLSEHFNVSVDYLLGREELKAMPVDPMTQILITHFNKLSPQDKIDFLNAIVERVG